MLKKRLPIEKVTGIVVFRAHSLFESCQEALVLRLYRQNNKVRKFNIYFQVTYIQIKLVFNILVIADLE